jgi:NADH-quinone oxidoreductase subunit J
VFARHNAVDTPALLPDGSIAELSVSRVLKARGTVRPAPEIATPPGLTDKGETVTRPFTGSPMTGRTEHDSTGGQG